MKKFLLLIVVVFSFSNIFCQNGEKYIKHYYAQYYAYGMFGVKSIEVKLSSPEIIKYLKKNDIKENHYLLRVLFAPTGELLFRPLLKKGQFSKEIENNLKKHFMLLEKEFRNIFSELNLFLLNTPFWDIPEKYEFVNDKKFDIFKFQTKEKNVVVNIAKYFDNKNGILSKQIYSTTGYDIKVYPYFKNVSGKMFCTGWDTQIFKNEKLSSGTGVRFHLEQGSKKLWLPSIIKIMTQTPENPDEPIWLEIYLHDFKIKWVEKDK